MKTGLLVAGCALIVLVAGATVAANPDSKKPTGKNSEPDCTQVVDKPKRGEAAVDAIKAHLPQVAELNRMSADRINRELRRDQRLWIDKCGRLFYTEPTDPLPGDIPVTSGALIYPPEQTFTLHSRPGANRVIYLDFDGELIAGTAWNSSFNGGQDMAASAFDTDGNPGSFTDDERGIIQSVWARVSEDFAAFDVDVTTQDPGLAAIDRVSSSDAVYGTRALITRESQIFGACGCAGLAYVGTFDTSGSHQYYQPALVFQRGTGNGPKTIAEVVSHEVGHNLGLTHDGSSTTAYYSGHGSWAPIMGTAYSRPISQWSRGEYNGANNTQDDFSTMVARGVPLRTDDVSDSRTSARALEASATYRGRIGTATDVDWFSFQGSGQATITANPAPISPNLDIALELYDSAGSLMQRVDPTAGTTSGDIAFGLGATVQVNLPASGTYFVKLDGTGYGSPQSDGYSGYASVGTYELTVVVSDSSIPPTITTSTLPTASTNQHYSAILGATGGEAPYTWGLTADSAPLPDTLTLKANTGEVVGMPNAAAGSYSLKFKLVDKNGNSATKNVTLTLADPPLIITSGMPLPPASYQVPYSTTLTAAGGRGNYVWSLASGTLPLGVSLSASGTISGTPAKISSYSFTVRVTSGVVATTKALSIPVTAPVKVTTTALNDATIGSSYSASIAATGGTRSYVWEIDAASLPPGMSVVSLYKISGIPTVTGTYTVAVRVTDTAGRTATANLPLTVYGKPVIVTNSIPNATRSVFYTVTLAGEGGKAPYKWSRSSGSLPRGFAINSTTGVISGTTTYAGTYTVIIKLTDAGGRYGLRTFTFTVV